MSIEYSHVTKKEYQIIENNANISKEVHTAVSYFNKVCVKPWGYEFLVYESSKLGIWFLKIVEGQQTSLHTHFHKDTLLFCLSGSAKINFTDGKQQELSALESVYIPKYKFHGIGSFSPHTFLLEIEIFDSSASFSDKNDLLRIDDMYKRNTTGYESSVKNVTENIKSYNHFQIKSGFKKLIEGIEFSAYTLNDETKEGLSNYVHNILLDGTVSYNGIVAKEGSLLQSNLFTVYQPNSLVLSLNNLEYKEDAKIVYNFEQLKLRCAKLKEQGKRIVLTSGCFDILHVGHLQNIKKSKALGDVLMVCLSNDEQIKRLKGDTRPINNYQDRINLFKTIPYVDAIILYNENNIEREETLGQIMKIVDPYTWVKGSDYTPEKIYAKHPYLKKIDIIENVIDKSTTNIIKKITVPRST